MLTTEEVHAAKREEWSCQLAVINTHDPLPPFVIANQCAVVDGGQSLCLSDGRHAEPLQGNSSIGSIYNWILLFYAVT